MEFEVGNFSQLCRFGLRASDHDFSGFHEGDGGFARLEVHFADGVGGNDGCDTLVADGENHFGEEAFDGDFEDGAEQLVAAADAGRTHSGRGGGQKLIESIKWDAVVAARGLDGPDAPGQNPVFEHGVADAEFLRRLAGCEQVCRSHGAARISPACTVHGQPAGMCCQSPKRWSGTL